MVLGVVHAKVPFTDAVPPLNVEDAKLWPQVMVLDVGHAVIVGVSLPITWLMGFKLELDERQVVPLALLPGKLAVIEWDPTARLLVV
jgi:hypothetical protein